MKYDEQMENLTHPSAVWIENELQISQPVDVKSTNDLIARMWH